MFEGGVLVALALVYGVVDEDRESRVGQTLAEALIEVIGLALGAVPAGAEDCRRWTLQCARKIEIRCHLELGAALKDDLFDTVAWVIDGSRHPGIEGRSRRTRGKGVIDRRTDALLIGQGLASCGERAEARGAFPAHLAQPAHVGIQDHMTVAVT